MSDESSITQEMGSMTITQDATEYSVLGTLEKLLPPLSIPTAIDQLPAIGYKQVTQFVDDGSDGVDFEDGKLVIKRVGTYFTAAAYATFIHSASASVVGFVFGFERNGLISFSQRPLVTEAPNNDESVTITGGGKFAAEVGDKVSVWLASNKSGSIGVTNANLTILRKL